MITSYKTKHRDVNSRYKMAEFAGNPNFPCSFNTKTSQNSEKRNKTEKEKEKPFLQENYVSFGVVK